MSLYIKMFYSMVFISYVRTYTYHAPAPYKFKVKYYDPADSELFLIVCRNRKLNIIVKLREREGQRVDLGRSLKGHLWMVDGGWWYTFP